MSKSSVNCAFKTSTRLALLAALAIALPARAAEPDIRRDATVEAVQKVLPSVVNIAARTPARRQLIHDWWFSFMPLYREIPSQDSAGSGVIIDEEGYIITNVHVIEHADLNQVWVKFSDDRPPMRAQPIAGMLRSDVALLKLIGKPGEKFTAAKFAMDDDVLLGETVIALGNPFGLGTSVSRGILSSNIRRTDADSSRLTVADWLQTDAAINPGNSGGPLINLRGEVVGINVAVSKEGQGIGFAIPIKHVSAALSEFFTPEVTRQLWLGLRLENSSNLTVKAVQPGSPAEKAGIRVGDRVLQVNGKTPKSLADCNEMICADETIKFALLQSGQRRTAEVRAIPFADLVRQKLGISVQENTSELARALGLRTIKGLVVAGVDKGSPAEKADVQTGQVILGIDGEMVNNLLDTATLLWNKRRGDPIRLLLEIRSQRGNTVLFRQGTVEIKSR